MLSLLSICKLKLPIHDILIVATGSQLPTVSKEHDFYTDKELLILDLSIPKNVANDVLELPTINLVHLDDLSKITDEYYLNVERESQIPKAEAIIDEIIKKNLLTWLENS